MGYWDFPASAIIIELIFFFFFFFGGGGGGERERERQTDREQGVIFCLTIIICFNPGPINPKHDFKIRTVIKKKKANKKIRGLD